MAEASGSPSSANDLSEMPPKLLSLGEKITEYYLNLDPGLPMPESEMGIKFRKIDRTTEQQDSDV